MNAPAELSCLLLGQSLWKLPHPPCFQLPKFLCPWLQYFTNFVSDRACCSDADAALFCMDGQANMRHVLAVVLGVPFSFSMEMTGGSRCLNEKFLMSSKLNNGLV